MLKLGKRPFVSDRRDLRFTQFRAKTLPKPPRKYGHGSLVPDDRWQMLGNDLAGDCVWAGGAHEHILGCAEAGTTTEFNTDDVLAAYSAVTGYVKGDESTDNGTDVREALKYRQATGIKDAAGKYHQIGAYVKLQPGNFDHVKQAISMFGYIGIGIEFPESAMDQFNAGKPWTIVRGAQIDGGHYVPVIGYDGEYLECVTWGKRQRMRKSFFVKYNDESWAMIPTDALASGKTIDGFDSAALQDALKSL